MLDVHEIFPHVAQGCADVFAEMPEGERADTKTGSGLHRCQSEEQVVRMSTVGISPSSFLVFPGHSRFKRPVPEALTGGSETSSQLPMILPGDYPSQAK